VGGKGLEEKEGKGKKRVLFLPSSRGREDFKKGREGEEHDRRTSRKRFDHLYLEKNLFKHIPLTSKEKGKNEGGGKEVRQSKPRLRSISPNYRHIRALEEKKREKKRKEEGWEGRTSVYARASFSFSDEPPRGGGGSLSCRRGGGEKRGKGGEKGGKK